MKNYELTLQSAVSDSFRCVKAANSLDIDAAKKSVHHFKVAADLDSPFNIGLVVGASGSGKTTLAKHIWGDHCFDEILDLTRPVIDQFPDQYSYDECAAMLAGVGLTSVPCWIRPAYTLSNGQRARAECALQMAQTDREFIVIDEWTSVVDRTVAKVMSHCVQKHAFLPLRRCGMT
jgi:ABC-type glutathione transport system ATPase component